MSPEHKSDVLVVDDEAQIRHVLCYSLDEAGYAVREAPNGRTALGEITLRPPDAVILDLRLPDISGNEVLRALRPMCDAPVLILSVLGEEENKIAALDEGADDYLTKPFGGGELLARLRALLRRKTLVDHHRCFRFGPIDVDLSRRWVTRDGRQVRLTSTEFELLRLMIMHRDKVVTHRKILRELWGPAAEERIHYVRTYMARLRTKLGEEVDRAGYFQSESGIGYRFVTHPELLQ
jgi:two-component system KDP operon response regulator KdpE